MYEMYYKHALVGLQGVLADIASQLIPADVTSSSGALVHPLQKLFKSIVAVSMIGIIIIAVQQPGQRPSRILKLIEYTVFALTVVAIAIGAIISVCV